MKNWTVTFDLVEVHGMGVIDRRQIRVEARTENSAARKAGKTLGYESPHNAQWQYVGIRCNDEGRTA